MNNQNAHQKGGDIVASTVNAWVDDDKNEVVIAIREVDTWKRHRLTLDQGIQLADQLRLLTHSHD